MCDLLVALPPATANGRTLFAKNSDRPPDEEQVLEWLPRHDGRDPSTPSVSPPEGPSIVR